MTEKAFLKKIGARIKELRTNRGISQQELAAELNYEKSNMSRLESGKTNPRIATLKKVSKVFKITLSEFLNFED